MNVPAEKERKAPLFQVGPTEYIGGFKLGKTVVQGAALMVELIHENDTRAGFICSSLASAFSITPAHISEATL
ncbi:MAG: hypothetical protein WDZ74_00115 [Candidatus Paceibacterota bacterium]